MKIILINQYGYEQSVKKNIDFVNYYQFYI